MKTSISTENHYISINGSTGEITVNKIDRDKNDIDSYTFTVMAYVDPPDQTWHKNMVINLHVLDIDNNPPVITKSTVNKTIVHDFENGEEKVVNLKFIENYASSLNTSTLISDNDTVSSLIFSCYSK